MTKTQKKRPNLPVQKRVVLRAIEIEAIEFAAKGLNQEQIRQKIGRTRSAVSKILSRTEQKLVQLLKDRGEGIKAKQTVFLEQIYRESMTAWHQSKEPTVGKKLIEGGKDGTKAETSIREQFGDSRFLDQARSALSDIRKIWGLDESQTKDDGRGNVAVQVVFQDDFFARKDSFNNDVDQVCNQITVDASSTEHELICEPITEEEAIHDSGT